MRDDGTWKAIDRKLQMIGPVVSQEAQIKSDLVANRNWLDIHSDQAGSRLYQEISKQTKELTHLDVGRQLEAVHRGWMDNMLMPLGKKFASTGKTAGKRIQQMLNRYGAIAKSNADGVEAKARIWTKALQDATEPQRGQHEPTLQTGFWRKNPTRGPRHSVIIIFTEVRRRFCRLGSDRWRTCSRRPIA